MSVAPAPAFRSGVASRWQAFETWVGTRSSAAALFALALGVFAVQSLVLPAYPGRDMGRYVQAYVQYWYEEPVYPAVLNTRGPLSSLGVSVPLELGGVVAEAWLALLYAASIVGWAAVARMCGARAAVFTAVVLLAYPSYGILFHGLASDALFAAGFAGWALLLTRTVLRPSIWRFAAAGAAMGALVLVRPGNQVLIVFALLPLVLRAPWNTRFAWFAAFFSSSVLVVQAWYATSYARHGEAVGLRPSLAVVVTAVALVSVAAAALLVPARWRTRVALVGGASLVLVAAIAASRAQSPTDYARSLVQSPSSTVFLYRAFELERIVSPDNGPASEDLARVVQRELLSEEPYRSYGVDLETFFSSGSNRIFGDLTSLSGQTDLDAVTREAIREHPGAFLGGIAHTIWDLLSTRRVYAPEAAPQGDDSAPPSASDGPDGGDVIVVKGRTLPRPTEGQPIPSSRVGPEIHGVRGGVREVWLSATEHPTVFDDPYDEQRYRRYMRDTTRLANRLPTRDANDALVHRLNQASHAFPPPGFWLVVGALALAVRWPRRALVALVPSLAAIAVIVATGAVAPAVAEYAAPVSPAFIVLTAAGLLGAEPRRRLIRSGRGPLAR
jgi:hypothetical protein